MSDIEEIEVRGGQGQVLDPETYRDSIGTMEQSGKRKWVFPRKPKGKYTNYRNIVSYVLLIIYFSLPFIKINGNPLLMFNVIDREFFIFGQPFYPQDFFYPDFRSYCIFDIYYCFYHCIRKNFLRVDMPSDNFYGINLP